MKHHTLEHGTEMFWFKPQALALSALLLQLSGCSLSGITDFEPWECTTDADCRQAFNEGNGYYPDCAAFKCEEQGDRRECVRVGEEICDGLDNDCDRLVDETVDGKATLGFSRRRITNLTGEPEKASIAVSETFGEYAYVSENSASELVPLEKGDVQFTFAKTTPQQAPDGYTETELGQLTSGCYTPSACDLSEASCEETLDRSFSTSSSSDPSKDGCALGSLATSSAETYGFFAGIRTEGCSAGELRVGVMDPDAPEALVVPGRGQRNPAYRGVATRGSRCSSNLTKACDDLKEQVLNGTADTGGLAEVCGVSEPSVAAQGTQGLVAYLGAPANKTECTDNTPVLALGLELKSSAILGTHANPSGDGEPDVLGSTNGGAAPPVLAVSERGFVVAFGEASGGIDLVWIPLQASGPTPRALTSFPEYEERGSSSTPPLEGITRLYHIDTGDVADGLTLASLDAGTDEQRLAVAWVAGCARKAQLAAAEPLFAQVLRLDLSTDPPAIDPAGDPVDLGTTTRTPILVPSTDPFLVPGFKRGQAKATEDTLGGFFVVAQPTTRAQAVRIASLDGQRVDAEEALSLDKTETFLTSLGEGQLLAFEASASELRKVTFSCEK